MSSCARLLGRSQWGRGFERIWIWRDVQSILRLAVSDGRHAGQSGVADPTACVAGVASEQAGRRSVGLVWAEDGNGLDAVTLNAKSECECGTVVRVR